MSFQAPPGSIPYPVTSPMPQPAVAVSAHPLQNIPSASVPRSLLPSAIPIVDNSGGGQQTIGHIPVRTQHMPPSRHPDDKYVEQATPVDAFQNLTAVAAATPQAGAETEVHFSMLIAGVPEEFDWSYSAIVQSGNLLVFVSPNNVKSWFPPDRDESLALRIGNSPEVHLGRVLPLSFVYNDRLFRFIMSLEQQVVSQ